MAFANAGTDASASATAPTASAVPTTGTASAVPTGTATTGAHPASAANP